MAEIESKFRIKASATGFTNLERSADRLAAAFRRVGQAGLEMGKNTQQGMRQVAKTLRDSGTVGGQSAAETSRGARGSSGSGTISTGAAAAMRAGHGRSGGGGAGGTGGSSAGGGAGGGGGGRRSAFAPPAERAAGSFTQGLLQGALPESFIERGPGAYRQAAGSFVGRTARQTASAALNFALASGQGAQGIANAVGAFPIVGGALAGYLGGGISDAKNEIGTQRSFARLMPYINGSAGSFDKRFNEERDRLGGIGLQYAGIDKNQALGEFAAATAQSGGLTRDYSNVRLARALQAQQGYGVDLGTSLRIMRGEDQGQVTGGRSAGTLNQALGNASALDLKGAEVGQYLRRMAGDIEQINQTGIKFSASGQGELERVVARGFSSAAGTRQAEIGRNLNSGLDSIARGGPQNSAQAMVLQDAGFDPSRPETYATALRNIEDPDKKAAIIAKSLGRYQKTISGYSLGQRQLQTVAFLEQLQTHVSNQEAYDAVKSGDFSKIGQTPADQMQRTKPVSDEAMRAQSYNSYSAPVARSSFMANTDINIGREKADKVLTADETANEIKESVQGVGNAFLDTANFISQVGHHIVSMVMPASVASKGANTAFR